MKKNYFIYLSIILSIFLFSSCGKSREEKINDAFLEDSLQYEQTELLKQSNKKEVEIDTAMNNPNSKDPATPVFDD
ncbi:hypothetical protein Fleli_2526 [Bernardetia litoralis DSM 6794]|uniref:Lipoprotein n=1 Tax=Bernardetia litoralis (strain ATCC 23117 / DSM 6794 / NBRC 15988 / NCIMB 1366 / Fx l1 / Sio-4) TaxID=880071 RepID=I4ALQ6_BERLS|nr:hypothetical protein [Bernardetia litoralis]AFM04891.1 hypothetical protein Fleli_2526 [Bernardetia litoralis DSM 6794]